MCDNNMFLRILKITFGTYALILFLSILISLYADKFYTTEKILLYSISTNEEISGEFTLGNGKISTQEYVTAYKINDDGSKEYYKMPREKTKIYEILKQDEQAYAEVTSNGWGCNCRS